MEFKDLIKKILRYNKNSDINLLERAYDFSNNLLKGQIRVSGQPQINHYLDVAYEVAELKLDDDSIAAALMHGIINKGANVKELKKLFNENIIEILENIERMSEVKKNVIKNVTEAESLRKVLLAATKDIRALLIKICDKLVNLRDVHYLPLYERKRIAKEAIDIYAQIAYRLGIGKLKSDIEDLAFKYLDEENYRKIEEKVNAIRRYGEKSLFKLKRLIEKELENENIEAIVQARIKHIYSIYKKIMDRSYDINNMGDIVGFRIIVNNLDDCYKVLRIVHNTFRPIPDKFKDYIAMPKPNGYQSLHTSVVDNEGKIFEIQIRTQEMHENSEEGIAAHFTYKKISHEKDFDKKLNWLKQLVESKDASNKFNIEFFGDEVFAFTPKRKVIELPFGSTVLDFAYAVHTDLGDHCTGANINGKFVSLKEKLENGDIVDVITSKTQKLSRELLKFVKTTKARDKIRQRLRELGKTPTKSYSVEETRKKEIGENLLMFEGDKRIKVKLALCCKPIPGDNIIGIKSSNIRLNVHKFDCKDIVKTEKKKIKVRWVEKFKKPVNVIIDAKDRSGLFKEILNNVSKLEIPISKARGNVVDQGYAKFSFSADVGNLDKLNQIIDRIKKIKDVKKVYINI